jgi:hypothetical protein
MQKHYFFYYFHILSRSINDTFVQLCKHRFVLQLCKIHRYVATSLHRRTVWSTITWSQLCDMDGVHFFHCSATLYKDDDTHSLSRVILQCRADSPSPLTLRVRVGYRHLYLSVTVRIDSLSPSTIRSEMYCIWTPIPVSYGTDGLPLTLNHQARIVL